MRSTNAEMSVDLPLERAARHEDEAVGFGAQALNLARQPELLG